MPLADPLSTSTSLLNQVRVGEPLAWQRLVREYAPLIGFWCRRYGIRGADVEDVTQNVFLTVSKHVALFDRERSDSTFRGWLWTITRSRIMDQLRAAKKHTGIRDAEWMLETQTQVFPGNSSTVGGNASPETLDQLATAIRFARTKFFENTWEAFWQTVALGRRTSEVARELGMTPSAVCMSRVRVLRCIRKTMSQPQK